MGSDLERQVQEALQKLEATEAAFTEIYNQHAELLAAQRWLHIDCAPKDGTEILLTNGTYRVVGYWGPQMRWTGGADEYPIAGSEHWRTARYRYALYASDAPTHWHPLPPLP